MQKIVPTNDMVFFKKNGDHWDWYTITNMSMGDIIAHDDKGSRFEWDADNFQDEVRTGEIYVTLHDEYEFVYDSMVKAKAEIRRLQEELDALKANNAASWYGDIVNICSGLTRTTIMINLQTHADGLLPSAGKRVKIT